jgi:benzoyl-CoA reductase/2-hydroxyglutaryl-CoA dehydratase subunit BcrC/BadD/HgdB
MVGRPIGPIRHLARPLKSVGLFRQVISKNYESIRQAAEAGKGKVAWCTSLGPAEILRALGYQVYFPENHGAILGASKASMDLIPLATANGFSPELCSYLTSDVGAFLKSQTPLMEMYGFRAVPKPDVLVYNTNQCKEVGEWFSYFSKIFKAPLFGIQCPHVVPEIDVAHVKSVESQLERIVEPLEKIANTRLDPNELKKTVKLSHDACALWGEILKTAAKKPSPITFFDAIIHMGPVVIMRGMQEAVDYYKVFKKELDERVRDGIGAIEDEKYRLYWDGMPMWGRIRAHSNFFAKFKCSIVASTYTNTWVLDKMDPNNPYYSMADAYTSLFINRTEGIKEKYFLDMVKDYKADGMVFHESKTCPHNSNTRFGMPQRLERYFQVPNITVQGDVCDMRLVSDTQFETTIEAFLESLMLRKIEGPLL